MRLLPFFALILAFAPGAASSQEPDSVRATCSEAEGRRVTFQDFQGLRTTSVAVVLRELRNHPGDRFSCAKWEAERSRLEDLDIFSEVDLDRVVRDSTVALTYRLLELPPYLPFVAVTLTDQDGLSMGPGLASLNLFGQAIRTEIITRFGGTTEAQVSFSSKRAWILPLEYDLAVLRVDSYNDFEKFHEDSWRAKLDLALGMGDYGWPEPAHILHGMELLHMAAGKRDSGVLLHRSGDWLPRLSAGLRWDGRDRIHLPRKGFYQDVRLMQTGGFLGGPADYREWLSDSRAYLPWSARNILTAMALYQFRDGIRGETFPVYDQFHVGGANTLRGYGHDAYRGKSECILTLENRTDLMRKKQVRFWNWGAFLAVQGLIGVEAASVWDHEAPAEGDFHPSAYAGVHLLLAGADRLRFEAGSKFAKFEFEWDLGILDKADVQRFRAR